MKNLSQYFANESYRIAYFLLEDVHMSRNQLGISGIFYEEPDMAKVWYDRTLELLEANKMDIELYKAAKQKLDDVYEAMVD